MSSIPFRNIRSILIVSQRIRYFQQPQRCAVTVTDEYRPATKSRSSLKGVDLLRNPALNKGMAFTLEERQHMGIHGLLPPAVLSQDIQALRVMINFHRMNNDLDRYSELMNLSDRNEKLFYRVIADNLEELIPIVYTPTVGLACQKYGLVFKRPRGLFITIHDKGHIYDILCNWTERQVKAIVVTDGERILGLGDLGAFGMGIPVGKLQLYTAIAGIPPQDCLPIMLDVGTNNEEISSNPLYIGLRQKRVTGKEYDEFLDEFMNAVVQHFGWNCLIQFEDFASQNAYRLLERYQKSYCTFNDDIQGTAAVVLAGLFGALRITGKKLSENTYLFVGAGQAACGIADLITHAIVCEGASVEEARSKIWMYDVHGLIVDGRPQGDLEGSKAPYVKKGKPIKDLASVIDYVKPTVLMGASGVSRLFHEAVLKKMAQINERPVIFALSNPTSRAECTAEEAYRETDGRCIFASGSPFKPVVYKNKTFHPGQGNNAYIFPAVALATIACAARHVEEDLFLMAAQKLGSLVSEEDLNDGRVYPPVPKIHEVTVKIAAHLAEHLYKNKKAWNYPEPENKEEFIRMQLYDTSYEYFGPKTWQWPEKHSTARTVPKMDENLCLDS
jgi:malate dehydrogenase (oxaloacetate-decarboxylating)(NADP+)